MTETASRPNGVLVPLLAGLAGAGIALLLAPRAGRETRGQMQTTANDIKQQAGEAIATAKTELSAELEHARALRHKLGEVIKNNGQRTRHELSETIEDERDDQSTLHNMR